MDVLRLLTPLVRAAGPGVRLPGRELLELVLDADSAPLYPTPPAWVQGVATYVGAREGVSPALLEAVSGELSGWDPHLQPDDPEHLGDRLGLMGLPLQLLEDDLPGDVTALPSDLEAGDREAAERVRLNVSRAARYIAGDLSRGTRLVHVLEYYVRLGDVTYFPTPRDTVRRIMGRYLWRLLEQLPQERARELLDSFPRRNGGR